MALTKFFRIASEGATVDGRTITREMIQQMAETYNPATYTANMNCEHLRGFSPEGPFNNWGQVAATKAEEFELDIGGKKEKRLGLYAQFDVTEQAKAYNKKGQKLFTSMETQPNFAGTGKAYLVGCAVTDSPASVATETLKFSRDDKRKDNFVQIDEFELEFEDVAPPAGDMIASAFGAMKTFFEGFAKPAAPPPPAVIPPVVEAGQFDAAAFTAQFAKGMEDLGAGMKSCFEALEARVDTRFTAIEAVQKTQAETIENTPSRTYTARPKSTGGADRIRADC